MRHISLSALDEPWDTPTYFEPVRIAPAHRHHALSISLAIAVFATAFSGVAIYHRLDTLSDIDTYVAMGPSQSHIEADHAASEPTLLVTLTPPVYASVPMANYAAADTRGDAVRLSAQTRAIDAQAITDAAIEAASAKSAETAASDTMTAAPAEKPVAADSLPDRADPVAALLSEESDDDSSM